MAQALPARQGRPRESQLATRWCRPDEKWRPVRRHQPSRLHGRNARQIEGFRSGAVFEAPRNGENWRFFSSARSVISRLFKHHAGSETYDLPCVASVGSGWLVASDRAPFFTGATPASCELQVARSVLARGETDIALQWDARAYDGLQVHNRASH